MKSLEFIYLNYLRLDLVQGYLFFLRRKVSPVINKTMKRKPESSCNSYDNNTVLVSNHGILLIPAITYSVGLY